MEKKQTAWRDILDMCAALNMAFASAAGLGYISGPGLHWVLHIMLWPSLVTASLYALSLILRALLAIIPPPDEHSIRYWKARKAGERRFREMFGGGTK